jgi:hypothetical protein
MEQQEIQERNNQIALMLGWKITDGIISYIPEESSFQHEVGYSASGFLQFHSDWSWLMESVEFIDKLSNYFIQIEEKSCYVYDISKFDNSQTNAFIIKDGKTKKEAVFIAVSDFAKLYNEKKL